MRKCGICRAGTTPESNLMPAMFPPLHPGVSQEHGFLIEEFGGNKWIGEGGVPGEGFGGIGTCNCDDTMASARGHIGFMVSTVSDSPQ